MYNKKVVLNVSVMATVMSDVENSKKQMCCIFTWKILTSPLQFRDLAPGTRAKFIT